MITTYTELLLHGTAITCTAWIISGSISLLIGLFFGVIGCDKLASDATKFLLRLFTFIARGIPAYVQILIAYFVLPSLLQISINEFMAAVLALSFCSSGYITEIIRSGINAIPLGQWEAAYVLGYSTTQTLRHIILPQMFRIILSPLVGEFEQLLKSTSLFATIGIIELTRAGMNIISRELNPIPVYILIASIYLLFSACLQLIHYYMQSRMRYGNR